MVRCTLPAKNFKAVGRISFFETSSSGSVGPWANDKLVFSQGSVCTFIWMLNTFLVLYGCGPYYIRPDFAQIDDINIKQFYTSCMLQRKGPPPPPPPPPLPPTTTTTTAATPDPYINNRFYSTPINH